MTDINPRTDTGIPTEPVGSLPRPTTLQAAYADYDGGKISKEDLEKEQQAAVKDSIDRMQATGSPVITDGEQTKPSFATYPLTGLDNLAPDGVEIPFEDGHVRQLPRLTGGPFRYGVDADAYLVQALRIASVPLKQAVIAPSALSLLYPQQPIDGYPREAFLADLADEAEADIRRCLDAGAHKVQLDFTEGRLSVKLDPSKALLGQFIELNNAVLGRFNDEERTRIGVHTCPGGDRDSTHSLDAPYSELLPSLFELQAGNFYIQLASEADRRSVLEVIRDHARPDQRIFVGVIDPIDPRVETPDEVRERVLEAAEYIPLERLGTTDDCGFSPFAIDDKPHHGSPDYAREIAFQKIKARVEGTRMAAEKLGVG